MPSTKRRISRARAILARLYHRPTYQQTHKQAQYQYDRSAASTPPTSHTSDTSHTSITHKPSFHSTSPHKSPAPRTILRRPSFLRSSLDATRTPSPRTVKSALHPPNPAHRARSDIHLDNHAMQKRLAQLEMIESENSSLKTQLDDMQRALDGMQHHSHSHVGQLQMADIENAALRFQLECLKAEFQKPFFGPLDVADKHLAWLNVDPV